VACCSKAAAVASTSTSRRSATCDSRSRREGVNARPVRDGPRDALSRNRGPCGPTGGGAVFGSEWRASAGRPMGNSGSLLPVRTVSRFPAIPLTEGPPVGRRCGA
jgi:hypothetical protein